jgi:hypothetical protein
LITSAKRLLQQYLPEAAFQPTRGQIAGVGSGAQDQSAMSYWGQEETRDALPARPGFAFDG